MWLIVQEVLTQVWSHDEWAHGYREQVADDVFYRVGVQGHDADGRRPLMVHLVDVLVQSGVMQQPETPAASSQVHSEHPTYMVP